jgi:L,D-peptidoglycan transpeptidase YkuD (ErfK/YbiS/YcfS/YnhG family)
MAGPESERRGICRRTLLSLPSVLIAAGMPETAQTTYENLEYRDGRLYWSVGSAAAAVGRGGVKADKREGDGATPAGAYRLLAVFYRPDRLPAPVSHLPVNPLAANHGWVDDPADRNYNRLVLLPYPASTEPMWRQDGLYDALAVIGYNMDPVVPGAGSAIFLHVAAADFAATAGCVAVEKEVLLALLPRLGPGSMITIRGGRGLRARAG